MIGNSFEDFELDMLLSAVYEFSERHPRDQSIKHLWYLLRDIKENRETVGVMKMSNYPKNRKPTGPRPNAGRPAELSNPVKTAVVLEREHIDWLKSKGENVSQGIRRLIDKDMAKG